LSWAQVTASVYLVLIAGGLGTLLLLGMRSARQLGDVLFWLAHHLNRLLWPFIKHNYLSEEQARSLLSMPQKESIACARNPAEWHCLSVCMLQQTAAYIYPDPFLSGVPGAFSAERS